MNDQPSSAHFIQASRVLKIVSPLGEDQLLPERVVIEEGVNRLFEIRLQARSKKPQVKPEELIGKLVDVSLEIAQGDGEEGSAVRRPFNGLVTALNEGPPITRGLRAYSMVLRPQMWLLSRRSDCRIWMDKTSLEVLETLFSEHGIPAPDTSGVISTVPPQHYSVQFNETDLAYLTRRLEEDGLFYWFSHENGQHKLHVADGAHGWLGPSPSAQGEGKVRLAQGSSDRNHINEWQRHFAYVPGKRTGGDWNFETPSMVPRAETPSLIQMPDAIKRELYEYPSRISSVAEAERAQKLRVQATEADHERVHGGSTSRILEAGRRFTPYEVAHPDHQYEEHVIVSIRHEVVDRSYETSTDTPEYENTFEALPARVPLTPHRETKRPRIEGTQVAIVAGPEGEEIHPDQYGRIKLWFPWDRKAKKDGSDTCWVRVAQSWGGGTWGAQIIPRIGMEVMVAFVDGDPDRPLVIGVVPNPANAVPYELPANKTKSTFRTNTHKGDGFNELSFEDANGLEEIFLHAQKDLTLKVLNHATERVDANKITSVGGAQLTEVQSSQMTHIGQNATFNIGTGIGGGVVRGPLASSSFGIRDAGYFLAKTMSSMSGSGNYTINASGAVSINALGASTMTVGGANIVTVGGLHAVNVGGAIYESAVTTSSEVVGGKKIIDAHDEILFRCGKSELRMLPDGTVELKGTNFIVHEESSVKITAARIDLN